MRILDRYLFREVFRPTLLGIGLYTFVLLMNNFFLVARLAIQRNLSAGAILEVIALQMPRIALLTIPMGILLGVLIGLGRLSADSEVVALRASGVSYLTMTRPIFLLGCAGFAIGLFLYHVFIPSLHLREARLKSEVIAQGDLNKEIKAGVFYDSIPGFILYADGVDLSDADWPLRGVFAWMQEAEAGGESTLGERILVSRHGRLDRDPASGLLIFRADRGELHVLDPKDPSNYRLSRFEQPYQQSFQPPGSAPSSPSQGYHKQVQDMSTSELTELIKKRIQQTTSHGRSFLDDTIYRKAWIERAQRYAIPFAAIAFALVGVPLGLMSQRGGRAAGFAVSLPVIIFYWISLTIGRDLATDGTIPLVPGTWGPNFLLLAAAVGLILMWQRFETSSPVDALAAPLAALGSRLPGLRRGVAAGGSGALATSEPPPPIEDPLPAAATPGHLSADPSGVSGGPRLSGKLPLPRLAILDRYVASLYLRILGLVLLSIYTIVWVVVSRNFLDDLAEQHLPLTFLLKYLVYYSPGAAWYVVPISALVASLVAVGLLERNNEVIAMRASGLSVYRVAVPVLAATLGICGMYYLIQERIAPETNQQVMRLEDQLEGRTGTVAPGIRWIFGQEHRLYSYNDYNPLTRSFQGLSVLDLVKKGQEVRRRTWADRALWSAGGWKVASGWQREWKDSALVAYRDIAGQTLKFPEDPIFFSRREESFLRGSRLPDQMSLEQLREHLQITRRSGFDTTHLKVAFYAKTAFPITAMVMVLLGLPFAFTMGRKGSLYGIGIAFGLVIVYWAVFATFNALGIEGIVAPPLSAWAPNLLFGLSGSYMLLSVRS